MWKSDKKFPSRGFSTPPPSWNSRPFRSPKTPLSERNRSSPKSVIRSDLFHVIHKVPAGDSPYVKAKQVQLIEKDPGRAVSLFWAAINSGDRVDSALKDMAIVMKQLDRSDEAIEAIKSFRHLCPYDAQESIDNVLVELYKRSGRIEEEIEMLQCKLRQIEEGTVFGGKRTKAARSQGKKVYITVEQETARILGNLAWAYLQQNNVIVAEGYYRRALSLEPDNNKKCNLAICLIHMNRLPEAKSLLQSVRASSRSNHMEEAYAKSFERAVQMIAEIEPQFSLNSMEMKADRREYNHRSHFDGDLQNGAAISLRKWSKGSEASVYSSPMAARRKVEVPFTQPKNCSSRFNNGGQSNERWRNEVSGSSNRKILFGNFARNENFQSVQDENFDGEFVDSTSGSDETAATPNYKAKYCAADPNAVEIEVQFTQPRNCSWSFNGGEHQKKGEWCRDFPGGSNRMLSFDEISESDCKESKKSWADMVEEEEEEEYCLEDWSSDEGFNDENQNSNILHQNHSPRSQIEDGIKDSEEAVLPRNLAVRRPLYFDQQQKLESEQENRGTAMAGESVSSMRRNRLQIFHEITMKANN